VTALDRVFRLNPAAQLRIESVSEDCPVLVVDQFYEDPEAVRQLALNGSYDSSLAYYPGLHSKIPPQALQPLYEQLAKLLGALGTPGLLPEHFSSDFSIVTTPASEMLANQKHPHIDGLLVAGVIYLSPQLEIGTCLFRHLPTGKAMLRDAAEMADYGNWLREHGEATQPAGYAVEQDGIWKRLHTISGRYNRLVMYPGNAFHSIDMRDVQANHTMDTARLTQRLFVNPPVAAPH